MTAENLKPKPGGVSLAPGAEALLAQMRKTGDSLVATLDGSSTYWSLSRSGLAREIGRDG